MKKHRKRASSIKRRIRKREQERNRDPLKKGERSELTMYCALGLLKWHKEIDDFVFKDGDGRDVDVITKGGKERYIEVKSSQLGVDRYFEKKEELRAMGREVKDNVMVVAVKGRDMFSVAEIVKRKLS